jgi:hypothetical protein
VKINLKILLILVCLFIITSCRKDEYVFEEPFEKPLLEGSFLADLMLRTTLKDGSADNIVDHASCLTLKLPISINANGIDLIINTTDDYNIIEAIFDDSNSDEDTVIITYPITLIFEDYTEVVVNSKTELNNYRNFCSSENEEDEDIECIDIAYPISFTTYNRLTDKLGFESINSDKELYEFLNEIKEYLVVNINFPVSLINSEGNLVVITNLEELQTAIQNAINDCDEDDDFNYNDDNNVSVTQQDFINLITKCSWVIYEFEINETHNHSQFDGYKFTFNTNGTATAINTTLGTTFNGTWSIATNNGIRLSIEFDNFSNLNDEWRLHEINNEDDGTRVDLRHLESELKIRQVCP